MPDCCFFCYLLNTSSDPLNQIVCVCVHALVTQLCPIVIDPVDCSQPGSSVHGILQARILQWVSIPFSKGSSWPRDQNWDSCIAGRFFIIWATREDPNWVRASRLYILGEGNGTPLQYSCLKNPMDRGAWWAAVHGVAKSQTRLSDFTFTFYFHALEREMATHSSVLAWRIPGMGQPAGLPSMGSHRVRHDWSDLAASAAVYILTATCTFLS